MSDQKEKMQARRRLVAEADLVLEGDAEERIIMVREHRDGDIYVDGYSKDANAT